MNMWAKLIEELTEQVPYSLTFGVGYYEGLHNSKVWIMSEDDLHSMYSKYSSRPITLWCDGRVEEENEGGRIKLKREESCSKRQEKENEVDDVYQDLKNS